MDSYQKERPGALADFVGQELFRVVLATYEPQISKSLVRTFTVSWGGTQATYMTSHDRHFDNAAIFDVLPDAWWQIRLFGYFLMLAALLAGVWIIWRGVAS